MRVRLCVRVNGTGPAATGCADSARSWPGRARLCVAPAPRVTIVCTAAAWKCGGRRPVGGCSVWCGGHRALLCLFSFSPPPLRHRDNPFDVSPSIHLQQLSLTRAHTRSLSVATVIPRRPRDHREAQRKRARDAVRCTDARDDGPAALLRRCTAAR